MSSSVLFYVAKAVLSVKLNKGMWYILSQLGVKYIKFNLSKPFISAFDRQDLGLLRVFLSTLMILW